MNRMLRWAFGVTAVAAAIFVHRLPAPSEPARASPASDRGAAVDLAPPTPRSVRAVAPPPQPAEPGAAGAGPATAQAETAWRGKGAPILAVDAPGTELSVVAAPPAQLSVGPALQPAASTRSAKPAAGPP